MDAGSKKKAEETISRRDDARATAWPSSLFGGNEKVPPCFKVAGDVKDKIRNMTISDARKLSDVSGRTTKNTMDYENFSNKFIIF